MDMAQGVVSVVVLVLARELAVSVLAMAMELVVSGEEQQVVARQVDSSFWRESNGARRGVRQVDSSFSSESNGSRRQLCRAAGVVDT